MSAILIPVAPKPNLINRHPKNSKSRTYKFDSNISMLSFGKRKNSKTPSKRYNIFSKTIRNCSSIEMRECNTLDYSAILPVFRPQHNISICWKRNKIPSENVSPGPGKYNPDPKSIRNKIGVIFEKSERELLSPVLKTDNREFYNRDASIECIQSENKGYSFPKNTRFDPKEHLKKPSRYIPGPGYYSTKFDATAPKTESTIISMTGIYPEQKLNKERNILFDSYKVTLENKIAKKDKSNNFQSFSPVKRFKNSKFTFFRILREKQDIDSSIIQQNKEKIRNSSRFERLRKIFSNKRKLAQKIETIQKLKEKIEESHIGEIMEKSVEHDRKLLQWREKSKSWKIVNSYVFLMSTLSWMQILSDKFSLRSRLRATTTKYLKIIYVSFISIGKFIILLKKVREKKLCIIMNGIVKVKAGLWRAQRINRAKKRISQFTKNFENLTMMELLIKKAGDRINLLKKWLIRILAKKRFLLAIENYKWNLIEALVLQNRSKRIPLDLIEKQFKNGEGTQIVPLKIREIYIKSLLKAINKHNSELEVEYWKKWIKSRKKALKEHDLKNTEKMLRGEPREKFVFEQPKPPILRVFISIF